VVFQEAVTDHVAEDPFSHRELEPFQELVGEGGGFVEAEAGFWMGGTRIRVILDPLEETIDQAHVVVKMGVQRRAEAMEKADGPKGGGGRCGGTGFSQGCPESPKQDVKDSTGGAGSVMEEGSQTFGNGEHHLTHRHVGDDVVHQVGCGLGHALGVTGRAGPSALAGKRHDELITTA
jgi:hypothetical protein